VAALSERLGVHRQCGDGAVEAVFGSRGYQPGMAGRNGTRVLTLTDAQWRRLWPLVEAVRPHGSPHAHVPRAELDTSRPAAS
jgi:hypothetical protein